MKNHLLSLFFLGASAAVLASLSVRADDAATNAPASGSSVGSADTTNGQQGQRLQKWREAFEQLNLTEAQKEQIKQIRTSTPAGKERRQQIMAVLTPDQKTKLVAMIKERRATAQTGAQ